MPSFSYFFTAVYFPRSYFQWQFVSPGAYFSTAYFAALYLG